MLSVRSAFGLKVKYLGKHTLFRFPFGWFFRLTGGIPVERSEPHQLVSAIANTFAERETLWLAIAPEGTRHKTDCWKSGFYYVALKAEVPVLCTFLDAHSRECGILGLVELSGDVEHDMEKIRTLYAGKRGIHPELESSIRLS